MNYTRGEKKGKKVSFFSLPPNYTLKRHFHVAVRDNGIVLHVTVRVPPPPHPPHAHGCWDQCVFPGAAWLLVMASEQSTIGATEDVELIKSKPLWRALKIER